MPVMIKKSELWHKIQSLYPEIGQRAITLTVDFDKRQNAWAAGLEKDSHELKHFLKNTAADGCMAGKHCVALGLEIAQRVKI